MAVDINVPDFDFSGFYYGEILDALIVYKRNNIPEISNENPFEPGIQLLRAFALVGHLNNTLLDMVAQETMLPTAKLRDSVVNLLALIGYVPSGNVPATAELRAQLVSGFSADTLIVTDNALFGTRRKADTPPILYEADAAYTVNRTDRLDGVWVVDTSGLPASTTWTDATTQANFTAGSFVFFENPGDHLYIGHLTTMTDTLEFTIVTPVDLGDNQSPAAPRYIVWEYNDGNVEDASPDSVDVGFSTIILQVNELLGTEDDRSGNGAFVFVTLNQTGVQESLPVEWSAVLGNYVETSGFLGQTSPSTEPNDYTVGTYWHEITGITDTTKDTISVTGEAFDTGDTVETTFTQTVVKWPLEPDTNVVWSYTSSAVAKNAVWSADGTLAGDAATGTTVDPLTGVATLVATSPPDGAIFVAYTREAQPFRQSGEVSFPVPKNSEQDWQKARLTEVLNDGSPEDWVVGSTPTISAFWLRCRLTGAGANQVLGTGISCSRVKWDQGGLYIPISVTQGRTYTEVAGSGDGSVDQTFTLLNSPVIEDSVLVTVDGISWTEVEDFSASDSVDEAYIVRIDSDGLATITFGDGINGKPPPVGTNNVSVEYRVGGAEDGNVGADQIRVNRSGLSRIKSITNSKAAFGWREQEGASEDTLEKLKRDGVASLRVLERAVTTSDIEYLATRWVYSETNQRPFSRAYAIENGFGPNTIKLLVVPTGGGVPSATAMKTALDDYYNGNLDSGGDEPGVLVVNHELTSEDYVPLSVDVTATVVGGNQESIVTALETLLSPEAVKADGVTYVWKFGGTVSRSKLSAAIFAADDEVESVTITVPATDLSLNTDELPTAGTITITVIEA